MRAAVLHQVGGPLVVEEVPTPEPGPGEVRVRVGAAGVCHSDLHLRSGEVALAHLPQVLGHENAGWVDALGPGAEGVEVGEPVVVFGGWGCGRCRTCLSGEEQLCDVGRWGGLGPPGGYAEHLLVPSTRHLLPLGDLRPVEAAPLTDAALTPYSAVKKALPRLVPGTTALLIGAGGLGQYGVQFLRLLSPARVVVVDVAPDKRAAALALGADTAVDPSAPGAAAEVRDAAGGRGVEVVLDCVGADATMALGASCLAPHGMFVLVGLAGGSLPFSFAQPPGQAVLTTSYWGSRNELEEVLRLAQAGRLVSTVEEHPLGDADEVLDRLARGEVPGRAVLVP